ncbi:MAG: DUF502 domain-containing protein [Elusimicrobiota bacterium]
MDFKRKLKRYLLTGFLIVAPISITLFLLWWFVTAVDHLLAPVFYTTLGRHVPGLGIIAALGLLIGAGWLSSNIMGKQILDMIEDLLLHIPVFNWLYRTVKQLTEVFSPSGKAQFKSVVMVEYPRPGVYQLGFVTNKVRFEREGAEARDLFCVYIATNHLYIGDIILVPEDKVIHTTMTLQDGIRSSLSAGAAVPDTIIGERHRGPSA